MSTQHNPATARDAAYYKVGDKVRIIANKSKHCLNIGEVVMISDVYDAGMVSENYRADSKAQALFDARECRPAALSHESRDAAVERPVDMLLWCPNCFEQHVDENKPEVCEGCGFDEDAHHDVDASCSKFEPWLNPPHKSHRCNFCNHVWRPSDGPTNGVLKLETQGKADGRANPIAFANGKDFNDAVEIAAKPAEVQADVCECVTSWAWRNEYLEKELKHHPDCDGTGQRKPARKELADLDREAVKEAARKFRKRNSAAYNVVIHDPVKRNDVIMADFALQMLRDHGRDERERVAAEIQSLLLSDPPDRYGHGCQRAIHDCLDRIDKLLSEGTSKNGW